MNAEVVTIRELQGRAAKVKELVLEIDDAVDTIGLHPFTDAQEIIDNYLQKLTRKQWMLFVDAINRRRPPEANRMGEPSDKTKQAVIREYRKRIGGSAP